MAGFWKVISVVALSAGVVLFFGYNPGPRQYSGGHEVAHTFELFSREDPVREIGGIFLFMILPVAIATALRMLASYLAARRSGKPFQPRLLLPVAIMCGIAFASSAFAFAMAVSKASRFFTIQAFLWDLFFAFTILAGPALLIVMPVLLVARYQKFRGREQAIPSGFMYATIYAAFLAQYFWLSAFNQT